MKIFKLEFTKEFTEGLLKGIQYNDHITMSNMDLAKDYVDTINENHEYGILDYKIIKHNLIALGAQCN